MNTIEQLNVTVEELDTRELSSPITPIEPSEDILIACCCCCCV